MLASAEELAAIRPDISGWTRDQRTLARLCAILAFALLSLGLNVLITSRDLLDLQQAVHPIDRMSANARLVVTKPAVASVALQ